MRLGAVHRIFNEAALSLVLGVSLSTTAYSQVGGSLQGTITDASGAVVPGVRLSITNLTTKASRIVTTDRNGYYSVPDLVFPPT